MITKCKAKKWENNLKQELQFIVYLRSMQPHARFRDKLYDFTRHVKNVIFASHQEKAVTAQERFKRDSLDLLIRQLYQCSSTKSRGISLMILITSSLPLLPSPRLQSTNKINLRDERKSAYTFCNTKTKTVF